MISPNMCFLLLVGGSFPTLQQYTSLTVIFTTLVYTSALKSTAPEISFYFEASSVGSIWWHLFRGRCNRRWPSLQHPLRRSHGECVLRRPMRSAAGTMCVLFKLLKSGLNIRSEQTSIKLSDGGRRVSEHRVRRWEHRPRTQFRLSAITRKLRARRGFRKVAARRS